MRMGVLILSLSLSAQSVLAEQAPTVQVETVTLTQQTMTEIISGYGVVSPDTRYVQTIDLPRPGQIVALPVNAGQMVAKGETLLKFATASDAVLAYQQARSAVAFAKSEVARTQQLLNQQLATQSQLAVTKKALADAEAAMHAQEKIGAGRALERVSAPFSGMVVAVQAARGDRLAAAAPVLQLVPVGAKRVLMGVEPEEASRVRPGMAVNVVPVFDNGQRVTGKVAEIFGVVNPQTQFVDVLVDVPDNRLMLGVRVRAGIQLHAQAEWVVPRSAVLRDQHGAYIYQVRDGKAHRVEVQTGLEQGGKVAVHGAFAPGDPVVSLGNYELQDGMAVRGSSP
jgi:membrane fusion protein (multidrug efflux system)